jgi:hypothetical protein
MVYQGQNGEPDRLPNGTRPPLRGCLVQRIVLSNFEFLLLPSHCSPLPEPSRPRSLAGPDPKRLPLRPSQQPVRREGRRAEPPAGARVVRACLRPAVRFVCFFGGSFLLLREGSVGKIVLVLPPRSLQGCASV